MKKLIKKLYRKITGIDKKDKLICLLLQKIDRFEYEIRMLNALVNRTVKNEAKYNGNNKCY